MENFFSLSACKKTYKSLEDLVRRTIASVAVTAWETPRAKDQLLERLKRCGRERFNCAMSRAVSWHSVRSRGSVPDRVWSSISEYLGEEQPHSNFWCARVEGDACPVAAGGAGAEHTYAGAPVCVSSSAAAAAMGEVVLRADLKRGAEAPPQGDEADEEQSENTQEGAGQKRPRSEA